jgi:hypothetical protein
VTDCEVKALWDSFRVSKCYPNMTAIVMDRCTHKMQGEYLPELNNESDGYMPFAGSDYWVETIDPPSWFTVLIEDFDLSDEIDDWRVEKIDVSGKGEIHKAAGRTRKRKKTALYHK